MALTTAQSEGWQLGEIPLDSNEKRNTFMQRFLVVLFEICVNV